MPHPIISPSVNFNPIGFIPTDEQKNIQTTRSKVSLVVANAGAAKTTTLALRIGEALSKGVRPDEILALTFTNEAKEVMQTRLVDIGIAYKTAKSIHVRTIEDFSRIALSTLEDSQPRAITSAREQRANAIAALDALGSHYPNLIDQLDVRTHNIAVSQFLNTLLKLKATMALALADEFDDPEWSAERLSIPLTDFLWAIEYERARIDIFENTKFRDFFDSTYDLACILLKKPETAHSLPRYKLVTCDELHDINEAAFGILDSLLSTGRVYFVGAGDKDQVIHSNLGADESFISHRISSHFPDCVKFPLTATYRHGPHLAYAMAELKDKPIESNIPLRTEIDELTYSSRPDSCGKKVVLAIEEWRRLGKAIENCCVLLRDHHQSTEIENSLMQAGIPYRMLTMKSYLHRDEILFLRGMIAIALENFHSITSSEVRSNIIETLATFGEIPLTPTELDEAKSTVSKNPSIIKIFFEGQINRTGKLSVRMRMNDVISYLKNIDPDTPSHIALNGICERMDMENLAKRLYVHPYEASVISKSVNAFIETSKNLGMSLRDFSEWLAKAEASTGRKSEKGRVTLECAEHSKGREFDHVILPFLEQGEFPNSICDLPEEENLFYVAATRTKSRLTLIAPDNPRRRSIFISMMKIDSTQNRADHTLRRNVLIPVDKPTDRDLRVAYANKDIVKALGAQWDKARKVWYVPSGMDLEPFKNWLARK